MLDEFQERAGALGNAAATHANGLKQIRIPKREGGFAYRRFHQLVRRFGSSCCGVCACWAIKNWLARLRAP